jgi:hypothetical protein
MNLNLRQFTAKFQYCGNFPWLSDFTRKSHSLRSERVPKVLGGLGASAVMSPCSFGLEAQRAVFYSLKKLSLERKG